MENEKLQNDIDLLLSYMNDDMESLGGTINTTVFSFNHGADDRNAVDNNFGWGEEYLYRIINICNSRRLLTKTSYDFNNIKLTDEGQGRALSVKHGKNRSYELGAALQISTLNVHGPAQVGNGNIQNINYVFNELIQKIDESEASIEDKEEAKNRLKIFLEHPLVTSIVGGIASSIPSII